MVYYCGVDALKVLKTLYGKGSFFRDFILMIHEIYLQKSVQYESGICRSRRESKFVQWNCCVYGSWIKMNGG